MREPWPLPAVVVAHHITYDGNPDSYPLHIASKVLSDGESSRIYKKLVYGGMAVAAFGQANLIEDPNLFYAVAIVQPPHWMPRSLAAEPAMMSFLIFLDSGSTLFSFLSSTRDFRTHSRAA